MPPCDWTPSTLLPPPCTGWSEYLAVREELLRGAQVRDVEVVKPVPELSHLNHSMPCEHSRKPIFALPAKAKHIVMTNGACILTISRHVGPVSNITQITPWLWVGGDLDHKIPGTAETELAQWVRHGVTDILDVRAEWSDEEWVRSRYPDIGYVHLGVRDTGDRMPGDWFDAGVRVARETALRGGTLLVHCHLGVNRGPSMAVAILTAQGWDPFEALDRVRRLRPIANVGYAEDTLEWWLATQPPTVIPPATYRTRLARWRAMHPMDGDLIVRQVRDGRRERYRSE